MSTEPRLHARTDVGRVRDHNEDNFLCDPALGLYVVADGMGGHAAGEVASDLAVHAVGAAVQRNADVLRRFSQGDESVRAEDVKRMLGAAVSHANETVFHEAERVPERRGMGTTLSVLLVLGRHGFIAHVGDSRVYLLRGGEVQALTEDHSVINELKRRGRLRPEVIEKLQVKNAVTRAVGVFETVEVDTAHFLVAPGDRFLLCSDGLHGYLGTDGELKTLLEGPSEESVTQRLVDLANERGGKDNITAVVLTIPGGADDAARELARALQVLGATPFFRALEPRELFQVQALSRRRDCAPGETVVTEGSRGESMYVVVSGGCIVRKGAVEIARVVPGDFFGEMSLVERTPRSATVVADGQTRLLEIHRADLFKLLREAKDTGIKLLWNIILVLTARLRRTSEALGQAREELLAEEIGVELFSDDEETVIFARSPFEPPEPTLPGIGPEPRD